MESDLKILQFLIRLSTCFVTINFDGKKSVNKMKELTFSAVASLIILFLYGVCTYGLLKCPYHTGSLQFLELISISFLAASNLHISAYSGFYQGTTRFLNCLIVTRNKLTFANCIRKQRTTKIDLLMLFIVIATFASTFCLMCVLYFYEFHKKMKVYFFYQIPKYFLFYNIFVTILTAYVVLYSANQQIVLMYRTLVQTADDYFILPAEELTQIDEQTFSIQGWVKNVLEKIKNGNPAVTIRTLLSCYSKLYDIIREVNVILDSALAFFVAIQLVELFKLIINLNFALPTYRTTGNASNRNIMLLYGRSSSVLLLSVSIINEVDIYIFINKFQS